MPSRRAHTKSRLGCVQCKQRRVKCDQTYPTCKNCVRHEKTCVYGQVKPGTPSTASRATSGEASNYGITTALPALSAGAPTFDSLDLKLMHHFCTSTATSLSMSSNAQHVWRNVMPLYAYTYHMLMHGVLTLSAHHYVHVNKSSADAVNLHNHRTRALHHHQLGLQIYRQQVQAPSEDHPSEILLAFAAVLGMLTFADADTEQQNLTFDDALTLLTVIRGKQALWRSGSGLPPSSDLAPAFFDPPLPEHRTDLSSTVLALSQLYDAAGDNVRKEAIAILKGVAESQTTSEFRMLGSWPAAISEDFLQLLRSRDDIALQTFEHYGAVLGSLHRLWWVGEFGQKLRLAIRGARSEVRSEEGSVNGTPYATRPTGEA